MDVPLRDRLLIDKNNLDQELIEQPELFYHAGKEYAHAVSIRDGLKDELRSVDGELSIKIRLALSKEKERVTEGLVEANLAAHPDHIKVRDALSKANEEVERTGALREAFAQRSWMLRELCGLYIQGYYALNSMKGDSVNLVEEEAYTKHKEIMNAVRTKER